MESSWWAAAIQWGLWALVMTLVMGWVARSSRQPRAEGEENILVYPHSILYIGAVCTGFFLLMALLVLIFPGKTGSPWIALLFVGFALLGMPLIAEHQRVRHVVEEGGLRYHSVLGKTGFLAWSDVKQVRYSPSNKWFRLDSTSGEVVRVSALLLSLPEFARVVLQQVPKHRIDPLALPVLEATAEGRPPTLWSK